MNKPMDEPQYSSETSEIMNKLDSGEITETPAKDKAERPLEAATCSPSSDTPETQTKVKRICGNWNHAGDHVQEFVLADVARKLERERNEARAMARDMRNQLKKDSRARLIFPWENAIGEARAESAAPPHDQTL